MASFDSEELNIEESNGGFSPNDDDAVFNLGDKDNYPGAMPVFDDEISAENAASKAEKVYTDAESLKDGTTPYFPEDDDLDEDSYSDSDDEMEDEEQLSSDKLEDGDEEELSSDKLEMEDEEELSSDKLEADSEDDLPDRSDDSEVVEEDPAPAADQFESDDGEISTDGMADQIEVPEEGSVWDLFDEEDKALEKQQKEENPEDLSEPEMTEQDDTGIDYSSFDEEEPQATQEDKDIKDESSDDAAAGSESEDTDTADDSGQQGEEAFVLDDELKNMLKEEHAKGRERQKERGSQTNASNNKDDDEEISEEELKVKLAAFEALDDGDEVTTFDLGDIDAKHPSSYFYEEGDTDDDLPRQQSGKDNKKQTKKDDDSNKKQQQKKDKKKKDRKPIAWGLIIIVAAALVLLSAIGFSGYYLYYNTTYLDNIFADDPADTSSTHTLAQSEQNEEQKTEHKKEAPLDTAAATELQEEPQEALPPINLIANTIDPLIMYREPEQITEQPEPIREFIPKRKPISKKEQPLYTIEVYATPSYEDAEMWKKKLLRKNINAYIRKQKIKNQIWHRVRFGEFGSLEEAKAKAMRLGFAQSRIDRVR